MGKTILMFPGQGSQFYGMGRELISSSQVFANSMRRLDELFASAGISGVMNEIFRQDRKISDPFHELAFTHPAIVMIELSLAELLREQGIMPDYLLGASLGEFAAAHLAGVIGLEDLATCISKQVDLVKQHCATGGMLVVFDDVANYQDGRELAGGCRIAAINSDRHFVLAGGCREIDSVAARLAARGVLNQKLPVDFAFHSALIDAAGDAYLRSLRGISIQRPTLPLISCASAGLADQITTNHFWRAVREPIRFRDTIRFIEDRNEELTLIDLGPSGTLANLANRLLGKNSKLRAIGILSPFVSADRAIEQLKTLGTKRIYKANAVTEAKAYVFPGQGSQVRGMGAQLFDEFKDLVAQADEILGYSIAALCRDDPDGNLSKTEYTQPALYVVNALSYLKRQREQCETIAFLAGHSLGEYNALFASKAFDFATGLRLVQKRGALMAKVKNGGMSACIGLDAGTICSVLAKNGLGEIDLANYNSPDQIVLSGPVDSLAKAERFLTQAGARACVRLRVSGAFHSRYMAPIKQEFEHFLRGFEIGSPCTPVIANVTARPYEHGKTLGMMSEQFVAPVQWEGTIRFILDNGAQAIEEIGPGKVLTGLLSKIRKSIIGESTFACVSKVTPKI